METILEVMVKKFFDKGKIRPKSPKENKILQGKTAASR